jgi:outer membrane immunogenic protein
MSFSSVAAAAIARKAFEKGGPMNFRTSCMAAAVLSGAAIFTGAAVAADAVVEDVVIVNTAHDWSGVYIGGHLGYGEVRLDGAYGLDDGADFLTEGSGPFDLEADGITGGIQIGYNWQSGNFVYGAEADITAVDWSDSLSNEPVGEETLFLDVNYLATVRARVGYAMDRTLIFGTIGAAFIDAEYSVQDHPGDTSPDESGSLDFDDIGLVVGGGAEYALNSNWSIKAEGLYYWFDDNQSGAGLTHDSDNDRDFAELKDAWMLRVGVNYHF